MTKRLNAYSQTTTTSTAVAAFIPMDGYHLTRAQLSALPNAQEAHRRRGAEFTFDGEAFLALVKAVRAQTPDSDVIYAPSFDHAKKDPVDDDIPILPSTKCIVFEGNYLSLNKAPWKEAGLLMDENWFVEVDFEVAKKRLIERHLKSGICKDREEATERATGSDLVNGDEILKDRIGEDRIDEIIVSRTDADWATD